MYKRFILISVATCISFTALAISTSVNPASRRYGQQAEPGAGPQLSGQKASPGIMFATILNNVTVNARGGWLSLGNQIQNVFMPEGSTGKIVLSKANGSELIKWDWNLDEFGLTPPYKLFNLKQALKPDGSVFPVSDLKLTAAGNYTIDFYIGDKKFYTYPFTVSTLDPANPFDGETMYFTEGAWNDWGYLFYRDANPENSLVWKIWLRERSFKTPDHKIKIEVVRDSDRKVICKNRDDVTFTFQHDWVRYEFDMVDPPVKTSGGEYFRAKDLLAVDGAYTLKMAIDGKEYGTWKFKIAANKPVSAGRTERGKADPLTFVEGGKDAFWYERVK
jgi:hypothetical protein